MRVYNIIILPIIILSLLLSLIDISYFNDLFPLDVMLFSFCYIISVVNNEFLYLITFCLKLFHIKFQTTSCLWPVIITD